MAVKANATISIYRIKEVTSTTNYYLLQSSTAAAPSKPTTDSPGGKWTTSEPAYTDGSTLTLYTVIKTKYSDNTFEYTPVSKSTSYEAAKSAYNKAQAAQNSATSANNKIDNLKIGGRNCLPISYFKIGGMDGGNPSPNAKYRINNANKPIIVTPSTEYLLNINEIGDYIKGLRVGIHSCAKDGKFIHDSGWIQLVGHTPYKFTTRSDTYKIKFVFSCSETSNNVTTGGSERTTAFNNVYDWLCGIKLKLEKGNKATDWTPAPEDSDNVISQDTAPEDTSAVWFNTHDNLFYKYNGEDWIAVSDYNEDISKLKEDVGKIDSTIDGKINAYNNEIKNTYYTKAQVDSQIETNERGIKEYYSGTLQTIREDTTGLSNRITAIEGYIQKGLDDNGQPFVELGTQASPYKLKITNDAIQITYLGEPVSNWKQDLIELNTVITSYLNLGKFSFVINSDDSLSFRKIR